MPRDPTPRSEPEAGLARDHLATAPWTQRARRTVYENPWIRVVEDDVELPTGHRTIYGIVQCKDAVGMLPFVDDDHVLLVQQYRYVAGRPTWEMPTGGVADGESRLVAAQRELAEEAGYEAGELVALTTYHTSKSVVDETAHLFEAHALTSVIGVVPDETELIRRSVFAFDDVVRMVVSGEITDSMTVIGVLLAARRRGG